MDWLIVITLVLAVLLVIIQDYIIKNNEKTIKRYNELMLEVSPILEAIVKAQEKALKARKETD